MEAFMAEYAKQLDIAVRQHQQDYAYGPEMVPSVVERMRGAIARGAFNKDSHAIRATCRKLGIKFTYKAIGAFVKEVASAS